MVFGEEDGDPTRELRFTTGYCFAVVLLLLGSTSVDLRKGKGRCTFERKRKSECSSKIERNFQLVWSAN